MPLTLREKNDILQAMISSVLAGGIVTDVNPIAVIRQILEGAAATQADLDYDLYTLLQGFYFNSAAGVDLDIRGNDMNRPRDPGQAASDAVTFTAASTVIDDIALPAPQVVQATLADGTEILYRSLGDYVLTPSGRSVSGQGPGLALTGGTNDQLSLNLNGDGVRTVALGSQSGGTQIAAAIETAVLALTAITPSNQTAYTQFRADYSVTTPGAYTLRSGTAGPFSSVVVTTAGAADASATLKLGVAQGGTEQAGQTSLRIPVLADRVGVLGNVGAGQINRQVTPTSGIDRVGNDLALSNGRAPASDDAYRQDIRTYILSLGRGTIDSLTRAVSGTLSADGQRHVFAHQIVHGSGFIQVFICDGRSLTVGAQADVVADVQDELDGLGEEPGGWIPAGNVAGVVPAQIVVVNIGVRVTLGPTPDLARAQSAITNSLYALLFNWPIGQALSYSTMVTRIDQTVVEMLGVEFSSPAVFASNPPLTLGSGIGQKVMPGTINVTVVRA